MPKHALKALPDGPEFVIDDEAYQHAKISTGLRTDVAVAEALGIHKSTWLNLRQGKLALTERTRARIKRVFPTQYETVVRRQW